MNIFTPYLPSCLIKAHQNVTQHLVHYADALPPLVLRLTLAWEFGEAGYMKLHGTNWFNEVAFPFPFNILPSEINWHIATAFELLGTFALVLGMFTRFFALSLFILTIVAIAAVHWPSDWHSINNLLTGYRFTDDAEDGFGNYKLPVLYMVMLLPLLFGGAGKWSLDAYLSKCFSQSK